VCRDEIEKMMEDRSQDYRLDPALRKDCQKEIETMCGFQATSLTALKSEESYVVECLQDFVSEIENPACEAAVARTISRGSDDIRFAVVIAKACKEDRDKFCKTVLPVRSPLAAVFHGCKPMDTFHVFL
jgi:Cysteine rich repeat